VLKTISGPTPTEIATEFDRQVQNLINNRYAEAAGKSQKQFRSELEPLRQDLPLTLEANRWPFALVVPGLISADQAISLVELRGKAGFTSMDPEDVAAFQPIPTLTIPNTGAYVLIDIDTGRETLNVTPDDAMKTIEEQGRSPLTLEEGIAVVTHYPELLKTHNAFSLLGSRCGDRRVTALWLSAGRPRLGWCWAGNPHTWLGSASCGRRLAPRAGFLGVARDSASDVARHHDAYFAEGLTN
jgi:hypothetical protein